MRYIRNCLIMPANNPSMILKSASYGADAIMFDLEDAVSPREKDAARRLLAAHLRFLDFSGSTIIVRVNPMDTDIYHKDMMTVLSLPVDAVTIPKVENAQQIQEVEAFVTQYERKDRKPMEIIPIVETPLGVMHCEEIAKASSRISAVTFGAADYTSSIGAKRSDQGEEYFFARSMVINACSAAGVLAIDTPCMELEDSQIILADSLHSRNLGFDAKVAINPRQIPQINEAFTPSREEVRWAKRILEAKEENEAKGVGVYALDGKMVDRPVILRAMQILDMVASIEQIH